MTSSLAAKTVDLLTNGRVTVHLVDDLGLVVADVEGTTVPHRVTLKDGRWACTCQAASFGRRCSHRVAVQLLVDHPCRPDAVTAVNS